MSGRVRPPATPVRDVIDRGFALLNAGDYPVDPDGPDFGALRAAADELQLDRALVDGGTYRYRRYGRLTAELHGGAVTVEPLPHTAFRQDTVPMWRGTPRLFAPIEPAVLAQPCLHALVAADVVLASAVRPSARWEVGLHMVRIVARPGRPGQPTPEGRHRDGHSFIGMHLLRRDGCDGGHSVVHPEDGDAVTLLLERPLDSLVVDDTAVRHEVRPVTVADGAADGGVRDILLVDLNPLDPR